MYKESLVYYDSIFPQYEDYHGYIVQVLFFMKYFGHFSLDEIYSLPIYYRNKMLDMLVRQLEKENGKEQDSLVSDGVDLNQKQLSFINDTSALKSFLEKSSVPAKNVDPVAIPTPRIYNLF